MKCEKKVKIFLLKKINYKKSMNGNKFLSVRSPRNTNNEDSDCEIIEDDNVKPKRVLPKVIEKKGYTFILNERTQKYNRLTKREFDIDEIDKFGEEKTKQSVRRRSIKDKKITKKEEIYKDAIKDYPEELRLLMMDDVNFE